MCIVEFKNVSFKYSEYNIIDNLSIKFSKNRFEGILGQSGIGKTTLIKLILGRLTQDKGEIVRNFKRTGVMFQADTLIENLSVLKNMLYVTNDKRSAMKFLQMVGLNDFAHFKAKHLSKGMKKRVEIARALCIYPELVVMDEPFGNLDLLTKINLASKIKFHLNELETSFIYITHDIEEALTICDNITVFYEKPLNINFKRYIDVQHKDKSILSKEIKEFIKRTSNRYPDFKSNNIFF